MIAINRLAKIRDSRQRARRRTRAKIIGSKQRPRLSVKITARHIRVQLIDDQAGRTLAAVSTLKQTDLKGSLSQKAQIIGSQTGQACQKLKIKEVVFDRGHRLYHGRIKILAEAVRKEGIKF